MNCNFTYTSYFVDRGPVRVPLAALGTPVATCNADRSVNITWLSVPGASNYLLRINNDAPNSPSWMDAGDMTVVLSGTTFASENPATYQTSDTHLNNGTTNIYAGAQYDYSIQPIAPNEKYPFSGARSAGTFRCGPPASFNPACKTPQNC